MIVRALALATYASLLLTSTASAHGGPSHAAELGVNVVALSVLVPVLLIALGAGAYWLWKTDRL